LLLLVSEAFLEARLAMQPALYSLPEQAVDLGGMALAGTSDEGVNDEQLGGQEGSVVRGQSTCSMPWKTATGE